MKAAPLNDISARTTGNGFAHEAECQCPTCGSMIPEALHRTILGRQRAAALEIEKAVETKFAKQIAEAEGAKKREIAKAVKEATRVAEVKLAAIRAGQDAVVAASLAAEREKAAKKLGEAVTTEKLAHAAEKLRLEQQLADLTRRLQAKTPHALGEPGEVALHSAISAAFTEEQCRVSRVPKGKAGPDIVVAVLERGATIGSVVIDCKNYAKWSRKFVPKLKADARALDASWAILASNVFPRDGTRGLCVVDGVIISDPGYVVTLVEMLRRQIMELHKQRLTQEARDEKATALLDFVASTDCADMLDQFAKISEGLLDLDVREVTVHQTTWRRRGELIRALQRAHEDFLATFDAIMNGEQPTIEEVVI